TGVLNLTGTATLAQYQAAFRSVTYVNRSENPSALLRTVTFTADDGGASNHLGSARRTITVTAVNEPPGGAATTRAAADTENQSATAIDAGLTVGDLDSPNLAAATVAITTGFVAGQDLLGFANTAQINGTLNAAGDTLTLTGIATVAQYQAALRSVTYSN